MVDELLVLREYFAELPRRLLTSRLLKPNVGLWHKPESAESSAIRSVPGDNRTFSDPGSTLQQCNVPATHQFARRCSGFTTSGAGPLSTTRARRPLWSLASRTRRLWLLPTVEALPESPIVSARNRALSQNPRTTPARLCEAPRACAGLLGSIFRLSAAGSDCLGKKPLFKCAAQLHCTDAVQVALVVPVANGSVISTLRAG